MIECNYERGNKMKLDLETAKTLTIIIGVIFTVIVIAWLAMIAILSIAWLGGII